MSAVPARTRPASRPERLREEVRTPELLVVEGIAPRRGLVSAALITLVVLAVAIIVPMIINTRMAETALAVREQQLKLNELEASHWTMVAELERRSSPVALEEAARGAGMVPAGRNGFVRLSTGTVEGGVPAR
ncbi:hypothetical protein I6B53_07300 [Schaalia sp. 19OD2882]|uniref:hypothetical protein n=1 Tax=Schaalia sp. 19OD2882 TaxID=2794089 RepID=UPI001C1EE437|nr:hypothetical protein [Schaalia sp. 19OD2882]QWW18946.1 hypothetical protein I6B53_07300 [Schaalia sp. 19OD2882]